MLCKDTDGCTDETPCSWFCQVGWSRWSFCLYCACLLVPATASLIAPYTAIWLIRHNPHSQLPQMRLAPTLQNLNWAQPLCHACTPTKPRYQPHIQHNWPFLAIFGLAFVVLAIAFTILCIALRHRWVCGGCVRVCERECENTSAYCTEGPVTDMLSLQIIRRECYWDQQPHRCCECCRCRSKKSPFSLQEMQD